MRALFVSSEIFPLAKTGGLADVSAALPAALSRLGIDVRLMLPAYPEALDGLSGRKESLSVGDILGLGEARLIAGRMPDTGLPVWLLDLPALYRRTGGLYQDEEGRDWPDNALRFAVLNHAAARVAQGALAAWRPDLVHANDWHTGLAPMLIGAQTRPRPATVFTIHNMAFQGLFPGELAPSLALPEGSFGPDGAEFYGKVSFLKAGIRYADRLTTVSPSYAREIMTPEYGFGFEGLLRHRNAHLVGILNGAAYDVWDPSHDPHLACPYGPHDIAGKRICKLGIQRELGLAVEPEIPLLAFLSRLTEQKMADVVLETLPEIVAKGVQFALVGEGDRSLEHGFKALAQQHPGQIAVRIGYREPLAHRLQAGADILLHPARFEPCGLTPIYALRYGTVPVVRRVGGLSDTIVHADPQTVRADRANGFAFSAPSGADMTKCVSQALELYQQPLLWRKIQRRAMHTEFGWDAPARQYLALYRTALADRDGDAVPQTSDEPLPAISNLRHVGS